MRANVTRWVAETHTPAAQCRSLSHRRARELLLRVSQERAMLQPWRAGAGRFAGDGVEKKEGSMAARRVCLRVGGLLVLMGSLQGFATTGAALGRA